MSEKAIMEGLQAVFQSMTEFANEDVVINDWDILDNPMLKGPYIMIVNSDDPEFTQPTVKADDTWFIRVFIYVGFGEPVASTEKPWKSTYDLFRDTRQAVRDEMKEIGTNTSAGGISGVSVNTITAATPITPWFDPFTAPEDVILSNPIFIFQEFIFETKELEQ